LECNPQTGQLDRKVARLIFGTSLEGDNMKTQPKLESETGSPKEPVRRRVHSIETFNVLRGGEYFFMPSLSALRWLADLQT